MSVGELFFTKVIIMNVDLYCHGVSRALKNWDDEILKAITHPVRKRIIESLRETNTLSFNELIECVDIGNHGKLGFHLRALTGLVEREPSKNKYRLTDRGQLAGELIWDIRFIISRGGRDVQQEPTRYVRRLVLGDHALFLYNNERVKREIAYSFMEAGLQKGEAVVYLVPKNKLDSESREIQRYGITADYFRSGTFTIISAEEWYLKKGKGQVKTIIANWLALAEEKQQVGFKGIRVAAEMETFCKHAMDKLLRYETALGRQLPSNMCGLCLYNTEVLNEKQLAQLTKCHSHLVSKDIAWKMI
ncbi:MAG TPA: MEDS domain-containing protein [Acidobacteriota bacterium]|nr:MEDS domain-containing protein [Acidobacteriota bacterium]